MSIMQHGYSPEQDGQTTRTLSPVARQRIILKLVCPEQLPLTLDDANSFNHYLRGTQRGHSDNMITARGESIFLDFQPEKADGDATSLDYAVIKTETALVRSALSAVIESAWIVPADSPTVGGMTAEDWAAAPEVSQSAQEIASKHRPLLEDLLA